ncbi:C-type natriuretic peptide 2 [Osmerus mordax]|uniref:C-type natriuretic peptide 2 n=1 Tax=Osmerus mordax TaxID=8014 RepID=UPI00350EFB6C
MSSSSSLLLLFLLVAGGESRPSPPKNTQSLEELFGARLSSLIKATAPEVTEGSANGPAPSSQPATGLAGAHRGGLSRPLVDFLLQRKFRGRGRKSPLRGCFGMKVDRIGSISGLGC